MVVIEILVGRGKRKKLRKDRNLLLKCKHPGPTTQISREERREHRRFNPCAQQRLGRSPEQNSLHLALA